MSLFSWSATILAFRARNHVHPVVLPRLPGSRGRGLVPDHGRRVAVDDRPSDAEVEVVEQPGRELHEASDRRNAVKRSLRRGSAHPRHRPSAPACPRCRPPAKPRTKHRPRSGSRSRPRSSRHLLSRRGISSRQMRPGESSARWDRVRGRPALLSVAPLST
jgi:hypothetical protein